MFSSKSQNLCTKHFSEALIFEKCQYVSFKMGHLIYKLCIYTWKLYNKDNTAREVEYVKMQERHEMVKTNCSHLRHVKGLWWILHKSPANCAC